MLLNTADKVYAGTLLADAVYLGDTKVWPSGPAGVEDMPGCMSVLYAVDEPNGKTWSTSGVAAEYPLVPRFGTPSYVLRLPSYTNVAKSIVAGVTCYAFDNMKANAFTYVTGHSGVKYAAFRMYAKPASGTMYGPFGLGSATTLHDLTASQLRNSGLSATRQTVAMTTHYQTWETWETWHTGTHTVVALNGTTVINAAATYGIAATGMLCSSPSGANAHFHLAAAVLFDRVPDATERAYIRSVLESLG